MAKEITLRMAKARPDELEAMKDFVSEMEAMDDYDSLPGLEGEPVNRGELGDAEIDAMLGRWLRKWVKTHPGALSRIVWGFDTLLRNVCDEHKDYLDWKPEIAAALKAAGIDPDE